MNKFNHMTIDLETMDNRPTAVITAIAAVLFDQDGNRERFYINVDMDSAIDLGLTLRGMTVRWWLEQSKAAQKALFDPEPVDITIALRMLNAFIEPRKAKNFTCWTHATFDAPILNYAYALADIKSPIHYRQHRDIRTLTWLCRDLPKMEQPPGFVAHNALDDALFQANYISEMLRHLDVFKSQEES